MLSVKKFSKHLEVGFPLCFLVIFLIVDVLHNHEKKIPFNFLKIIIKEIILLIMSLI